MEATTTEIIGFRVLGITDEVNACDCCGRTGLKATVEIQFDNEAEPVNYGRTCAARYARVKVAVIDRGIRDAATAAREVAAAARKAAADAHLVEWDAFLAANAPTTSTDRGERIAALGGFAAATAAFRAA